MLVDVLPLLIVLAGLVLYTVLGGADFGAGLWQLAAGRGERAQRIRDHAHHANAPVWEANHVWLILVLTVAWTAYPVVFGSIASTLGAPLFLAAIGIIFRGLCYTLQTATHDPRERRFIDTAFAVSSILTPFMLGTALGGVASQRVPVGNAQGNLVTSWLNPTSVLAGLLAVAAGAFLAAVYLAGDAVRAEPADRVELQAAFRGRAMVAGVVCGVLAFAGLFVVASDARHVFDGLTSGWGLVCVVVSAIAGLASLGLVWRSRFEPARFSAAVAVAAMLGGLAAAQRPDLLPGLTLSQGAADRTTMIAVVIAVAAGGLILAPSLALLFRLSLAGHLDPDPGRGAVLATNRPDAIRPAWAGRAAVASFVVGLVLLTLADSGIAHVFGVVAFALAAVAGYTAVGPDILAGHESGPGDPVR